MLNPKERLAVDLFLDEMFSQALNGEVIASRKLKTRGENKLSFRVIKEPVTKEVLDSKLRVVYSRTIGFYHTFTIGWNKNFSFVACDKQLDKLENQVNDVIK